MDKLTSTTTELAALIWACAWMRSVAEVFRSAPVMAHAGSEVALGLANGGIRAPRQLRLGRG
eukprot:7154827-Pyramimonas_sp.AAC.1